MWLNDFLRSAYNDIRHDFSSTVMHPFLNIDLAQLSVAERIQLAEDLWDSIIETPESVLVTEAQRQELDQRLEAYRQNPSSGSTWEEVKQRLTQSQ